MNPRPRMSHYVGLAIVSTYDAFGRSVMLATQQLFPSSEVTGAENSSVVPFRRGWHDPGGEANVTTVE